jgi:hypothetical protein
MKRLLRPFGYVGSLIVGAALAYFFHDKITEQKNKLGI